MSFSPMGTFAQGLINNGARIVLTSSSNIYINGTTGHYTSQSSGLINNNTTGGTITVMGNWVNNSSNTGFGEEGATVSFASSSAQTLGGTNASSFYKLNCSGGGTKTVNTGTSVTNLLSVGSSTTLASGGNITLKSTASSFAGVGPLLSGAVISGNVNVESYFTGGTSTSRSTRAVSSPINDASLTNKTYKQLQSYMLITGPGGTTNGFDAGGTASPNAVTLTKYNESATLSQSQYTPVSGITQSSTPGSGFFLFYRGNRTSSSTKLNSPYATPESTTAVYAGPINQGTIAVSLTYTNNSGESSYNGYNLVGNPYPATIDWSLVTKSNMMDYISIVKPGGGFAGVSGGIAFNGGVKYIQPGQGFYVRSNGTSPSITFTESCKSVTSTPLRLLSVPNERTGRAAHIASAPQSKYNLIRLELADSLNRDETIIVFDKDSKPESEEKDVIYLGGSTVSLSSLAADNRAMTINYVPDADQIKEVKLSINAVATKSVKLHLTDFSGAPFSDILLRDSLLNQEVNLKEAGTYEFSVDKADPASFGPSRLKLVFVPKLTISFFTARFHETVSKLEWSVANPGNSKIEVERSSDSKTFNLLAVLVPNSTASYTYSDKNPPNGTNYYRLKTYDHSGKAVYSEVVKIEIPMPDKTVALAIDVYPNPAPSDLNIKLNRPDIKNISITIYDMLGRKVKTAKMPATREIKIDVSGLAANMHLLNILNADTGELIGQAKFIKE